MRAPPGSSSTFGSLLSIFPEDVVFTLAFAAVLTLLCLGLAQLFAVSQDQEFARVAGLPVRTYNLLVAVLAAVSVTVAMRTVGLLLVSALMVVPVATAQRLARSFRATIALAMGAGLVAAFGGLVLAAAASYRADVAPGASIVLLSLLLFLLTWPVGALLRRRQRLRVPFADEAPSAEEAAHLRPQDHPHQHGEGCGHRGVEHGNHVDYLHDGHRHAPHRGPL